MKTLLTILSVCALLGACGGSSGSGMSEDALPAANVTAPDAFISEIGRMVGAASDSSEPENIDSMNATSPEDTEPMPVS